MLTNEQLCDALDCIHVDSNEPTNDFDSDIIPQSPESPACNTSNYSFHTLQLVSVLDIVENKPGPNASETTKKK